MEWEKELEQKFFVNGKLSVEDYLDVKDFIKQKLEEQHKKIMAIIVHTKVGDTNRDFDAGTTQTILNIAGRVTR